MTKKIIVLVGPSCSGKSTTAAAYVQTNPDLYTIVNRDKLREAFFGYTETNVSEYYKRTDLNKREKEITKYENLLIKEILASGKIPIVDATHLKREYLERFKYFNCKVELDFITDDLDVLLERNSNRTRQVGIEVIKKQVSQFRNLLLELVSNNIDFNPVKLENDPKKRKCIIFDIDGTLAEKGKRNAYDWKNVGEDDPIDSIIDIAHVYNCFHREVITDVCDIIFCSGRDEICRKETIEWLLKWSGVYVKDNLYMRKHNDSRPDWQVKREIWEEISKDYYIQFIVDDRCQVVDYARNLGLKVLQVEYNNF